MMAYLALVPYMIAVGIASWTVYELLSGNADRLMRTIRAIQGRKHGSPLGGDVPMATGSGFVAIGLLGWIGIQAVAALAVSVGVLVLMVQYLR